MRCCRCPASPRVERGGIGEVGAAVAVAYRLEVGDGARPLVAGPGGFDGEEWMWGLSQSMARRLRD